MSEVKVNKISPRTACGTTTLGDSGDTFTIPAGVTITNSGTAAGFGATGAASWDTTVKTATFTAVSGVGYFVNTTSGAITVTLPASPSAGDVVAVSDYAGTANTNNITLGRNSSNIEGNAADFVINQLGISITLVYVDATKGWITTDTGNSSNAFVNTYVEATGGTITCSGDYRIHTFTGPDTFCVTSAGTPAGSNSIDYLVVAGGGGGGSNRGGGGGAGGLRDCTSTSFPVSITSYPIAVGGGGNKSSNPPAPIANLQGNTGSNSVFSSITAGGGGGGGYYCGGLTGGSGGGGGTSSPPQIPFINSVVGGAGNTPPVSPPQGSNGGDATPAGTPTGGGGGGGATAVGINAQRTPGVAGSGGAGKDLSSTFGTSSGECGVFAGGGGGGGGNPAVGYTAGSGGSGGGGAGGANTTGTTGTTNTGGGGGGGNPSANGGSGIVIIRYKFQN